MAIHDITDKINLSNGESLIYTLRKKNQIIEQFHAKQKLIINRFYPKSTNKSTAVRHRKYLKNKAQKLRAGNTASELFSVNK